MVIKRRTAIDLIKKIKRTHPILPCNNLSEGRKNETTIIKQETIAASRQTVLNIEMNPEPFSFSIYFYFFFCVFTIQTTKRRIVPVLDDIIVAVAAAARGCFSPIRACIARLTREATVFFCFAERISVNNARVLHREIRGSEKAERKIHARCPRFPDFSLENKVRLISLTHETHDLTPFS